MTCKQAYFDYFYSRPDYDAAWTKSAATMWRYYNCCGDFGAAYALKRPLDDSNVATWWGTLSWHERLALTRVPKGLWQIGGAQ